VSGEGNRQLSTDTLFSASLILAAVAVLLVSALQPWIDPRWLFMDPQTVGELRGDCCHVYDGAVSTLGLMLWAGTAAIAAFAALTRLSVGRDWRLEAHACAVSAALLLDDAFLLHEVALPKIGIPQSLVIAALGVLALSYLMAWRGRLLRGGRTWLLVASLVLFAASIFVDQVFSSISSWMIVVEDGPKFIGIVCWFLFHVSYFKDTLVPETPE